jgi:hypothetical protein
VDPDEVPDVVAPDVVAPDGQDPAAEDPVAEDPVAEDPAAEDPAAEDPPVEDVAEVDDPASPLPPQLDPDDPAAGDDAAPPGVPRPPTLEDERDFDERLEREGGEEGRVTVTLGWDGDADLDLSVVCPDGTVISFSRLEACGGRLDIDMNAAGRGEMSDSPVENVVFGEDAPAGTYRVRVRNYDGRSDLPGPTPFRLRIVNEDTREIIEGQIAESDDAMVYHEFVIP